MHFLKFMKNFFKEILKKLDIEIVKYTKLLSLQEYHKDIENILNLSVKKIKVYRC